MPKSACSARRRAASPRAAQPSCARPRARRRPGADRRHALVERHRDVDAERLLTATASSGERPRAAVDVRAVLDAVVVDPDELAEAHHLEAAAVGQDRPSHP
jgi:hypothetical protein